jgi:urease subunit alpha
MEAVEDIPVNWGFLGKGNDSHPSLATLLEQIEAGACGLKDHEDWGTTMLFLMHHFVLSMPLIHS